MSSHPNPGPGKAGVIKAPDDAGTMDQLVSKNRIHEIGKIKQYNFY